MVVSEGVPAAGRKKGTGACCPTPRRHILSAMSDAVARLNTALQGRYAIERELGEGGMATVYQADDLKHGRKVALKVLKPELAAVIGAERFLIEIKTTANLQHPHILPLFDSGVADGLLYYIMPFIELCPSSTVSPCATSSNARPNSPSTKLSRSPRRWPGRSTMRIAKAWSIGTSSRPTSSCMRVSPWWRTSELRSR